MPDCKYNSPKYVGITESHRPCLRYEIKTSIYDDFFYIKALKWKDTNTKNDI